MCVSLSLSVMVMSGRGDQVITQPPLCCLLPFPYPHPSCCQTPRPHCLQWGREVEVGEAHVSFFSGVSVCVIVSYTLTSPLP